MQSRNQQLSFVSTRNWKARTALILFVLVSFFGGWFAVRWQLGNMLAGLTSPSEPNAKELAVLARSLAPGDPSTNWLDAIVDKELMTPEKLSSAIEGHENTVRLSPYHYQWWLELGRAYEQADKVAEAEKAFLRAVELAPRYTLTHWQLGNFYLRQGREGEAFRELKTAAESDVIYREQVFSIAWDYFGNDRQKLESVVGDSPDIRVGLAKFYAGRDLPRDSLEKWNSLNSNQRKQNRSVGLLVAQALFEKRHLNAAVDFVNDLGIEQNVRKEAVQNGGFEDDISSGGPVYFGWIITPVEKMRVQISRSKIHTGKRGLQIAFSGYERPELNNVYQTLALVPGGTYELSFWLKTEGLKSAGTPLVEILHPRESTILAASEPFPTGSVDWTRMSVEFKVPEGSEGVMLRTARVYCGEKCPIFGTFWYDDFVIRRLTTEP